MPLSTHHALSWEQRHLCVYLWRYRLPWFLLSALLLILYLTNWALLADPELYSTHIVFSAFITMFIGCLFFLPSLTYLVLRLKPLLSCHCFLYFPFPLFWDTDVFKPMLCKPVFCNEIRQAIASNRFLIQHMFVFWLGDIFTDIGSRCVFGWSIFFMSLRMKICTYHVSLFHAEAPFQWGCVTWRCMKLFPPEEVFLCAQFICVLSWWETDQEARCVPALTLDSGFWRKGTWLD